MNLTHFLPSFGKSKKFDENTPFKDLPIEEQERILAEEKAERVKWHREHVRNGPVKMRHISAGRLESMKRRGAKVHNRKANKAFRRDFMRVQQDLARLRGQLEVVGALPLYRLEQQDGRMVRAAYYNTAHPLRNNGLRGLFEGFAVAAAEEFHGGRKLDPANPDEAQTVIDFALHHYQLATGVAA